MTTFLIGLTIWLLIGGIPGTICCLASNNWDKYLITWDDIGYIILCCILGPFILIPLAHVLFNEFKDKPVFKKKRNGN